MALRVLTLPTLAGGHRSNKARRPEVGNRTVSSIKCNRINRINNQLALERKPSLQQLSQAATPQTDQTDQQKQAREPIPTPKHLDSGARRLKQGELEQPATLPVFYRV